MKIFIETPSQHWNMLWLTNFIESTIISGAGDYLIYDSFDYEDFSPDVELYYDKLT